MKTGHISRLFLRLLTGFILTAVAGCHGVDDTRIPAMPVYIDLSDQGIWQTYGVTAFGSFDYFIRQNGSPVLPAGYPYKAAEVTGYGGVLLICGMDPFTLESGVPLAYDLSCPVEKSPTVRVSVDAESLQAVCPVCDSHYDIATGAGAPLSGPALTGERKYGLRRYYAHPTTLGGYIINDYQ